ncbi:MAG: hypothetical protein LQ351_004877 [Letrouitia transgressa]|nr:MAG: hypothetical protein LQ351_004877 [Letrouitia transgressa]
MASSQTFNAPDEGEEAPLKADKPRHISSSPEHTYTPGKKRRCSSFPGAETSSQRQAVDEDGTILKLREDDSPSSKRLKTSVQDQLPEEPQRSCQNCGRLCWFCGTVDRGPPEEPEPFDDKMDIRSASSSSKNKSLAQNIKRKDEEASSVTESTNTTHSRKKKKQEADPYSRTYIGPRDAGFAQYILKPLGVKRNVDEPPNSTPPDFLANEPLPESRVVINPDEFDHKGTRMDFRTFKLQQYDEHTLMTCCWDSVMLRDKYFPLQILDEADNNLSPRAVRRDIWKPRKQGPMLPASEYFYDWDIEPDTTYAASINMFLYKYRIKLTSNEFQAWVSETDVSVCPYLTIEYKSSDKGGKQAQATNQTIAAAILWLNQRVELCKTVQEEFVELRHFMITIVDSAYNISELRPIRDGYVINAHVEGDLATPNGLNLYIEWSNAIHAWGLGANTRAFIKSIDSLIKIRAEQTPANLVTPAATSTSMGPLPPKI